MIGKKNETPIWLALYSLLTVRRDPADRGADDQFGGQAEDRRSISFSFQYVYQHARRGSSAAGDRVVDRGQWRKHIGRGMEIIEPDHAQFFGNADTVIATVIEHPQGGPVADGHDTAGRPRAAEQGPGRPIPAGS